MILPSPEQLREANRSLENEIIERKAAEDTIRLLNAELEARVTARTRELQEANHALRRANGNLRNSRTALRTI